MEETAILRNYKRYGFTKPVVGCVSRTEDYNNYYRLLWLSGGCWVEVEELDLIYIDSETYKLLGVVACHSRMSIMYPHVQENAEL